MCACACVPRRACARVCVRACASACMCARVCVHACVRLGVHVRVCASQRGGSMGIESGGRCACLELHLLQLNFLEAAATGNSRKSQTCRLPTLGAKRAPPEKSPAAYERGCPQTGGARLSVRALRRRCSCSRNYSHGRSCAPRERVCIECHPCRRVLRLRAVQRGKPPLREVPRQQRAAQHSAAQHNVPQRPAAGQARKRDLVRKH
jgi:hypothetical protein